MVQRSTARAPAEPAAAPTQRPSPPEGVEYLVGVAGGDVEVGVPRHGCFCPAAEHGTVRRLGCVVHQPGCHVAQLVAQRALQLGKAVEDLAAQLHARRVAAAGRARTDEKALGMAQELRSSQRQHTLAAVRCQAPALPPWAATCTRQRQQSTGSRCKRGLRAHMGGAYGSSGMSRR